MHMYGFGSNFGFNWYGVIWMVIQLALIIGLIYFIVKFFMASSKDRHKQIETAEDILKKRYANGEISHEEYQAKMDHIKN